MMPNRFAARGAPTNGERWAMQTRSAGQPVHQLVPRKRASVLSSRFCAGRSTEGSGSARFYVGGASDRGLSDQAVG